MKWVIIGLAVIGILYLIFGLGKKAVDKAKGKGKDHKN